MFCRSSQSPLYCSNFPGLKQSKQSIYNRCLCYKYLMYYNTFFPQKNTGQNGGKPKLDLNVGAAWAQGVTGKNVTTAIMDDGEAFVDVKISNFQF